MRICANFVKDGKWWVAWTEDVPGALTQGKTLEEARENLIDAIHMMQEPVDVSQLPKKACKTKPTVRPERSVSEVEGRTAIL